ncbi:methyl-accepting chemotaxis protein [Alteromonas lipolytica]|uniref:Chemotaxis protein n=1 Tax=Alteromonas lipolytica TaxID=1856405 RepID=A0A1E8FHY3_9ALTE|nr:methyl-accepting chemotaxis protein [Alteromonas lipolytica]OFI35545.1 chemotaxis protein [Alteromonas lipolytica]GGF77076.1 methyl-accepting chemotaxis protein [Alteromonas lipolytica]
MNLRNLFGGQQPEPQKPAYYELALNAISSGVMVADKDRNIIYANPAVSHLLKKYESEIRTVLPHFSAENLVGQNIDQFHKDPGHQRRLLADLTSPMESSIVVGDVNFDLKLTPVLDNLGRPDGAMVEWVDKTEYNLTSNMLAALDRSQGVIEFRPNGEILKANENFLTLMGYDEREIVGKHHRMFVDSDYSHSADYKEMWAKLQRGEFIAGEFLRFNSRGEEVWIQASYNPVVTSGGKVTRVVKYATDITEEKIKNAYFSGQIKAINQSQAVIEFDPTGKILQANDNFLNALGYTLDEIKGKHHSMFVDSAERSTTEYRMFWDQLNDGQFQSGEFRRIGKGGVDVWIQATYNPILDDSGRVFKVVKYATDITSRKMAVNDICEVMLALSKGSLTSKLEREYEGEFKALADSVNDFVTNLSSIIMEIRGGSETINNASAEIAKGNADLSSRTEQQASSLEETASSMEQITSTVQLNADNAKQANGLASEASRVASNGGKLIDQVVGTMADINQSAKKIEDIIGVIDGIAFQTNILALNAAVEAARAGEQGRGFAVVASEVRTLAQRSANAAKDIKDLISDSVAKVESGNQLVNQSGDTMREIVTAIQRVNDIMSEIASASAEQASGIDEINKAVVQMDEMTQQNAALVEEAAAAAESMSSQASQLISRVNFFELGHEAEMSHVPAIQSAPLPRTKPKVSARAVSARSQHLSAAKPDDDDEWESF